MNYKVGDTITVRSDIKAGDMLSTKSNITKEMEKFAGEKVTIEAVGHSIYLIVEDGCAWAWTDEMFENKVTIKTWEDLDGVKNGRYRITARVTDLASYELIAPFSTAYVEIKEDKNLILKWLDQFGFDVEFEKKPTLTAKEMVIVKGLIALDFYYLINLDGYIYAKNNNQPDLFVSINMFKFISNTKAFSLDYLVLLEVSDV